MMMMMIMIKNKSVGKNYWARKNTEMPSCACFVYFCKFVKRSSLEIWLLGTHKNSNVCMWEDEMNSSHKICYQSRALKVFCDIAENITF